ncbi:MAG: hypothetical protein IZT58_08650 [Actinobacteria bacterium]|nr:hypothetical protein [Actinomycetota bacterium]
MNTTAEPGTRVVTVTNAQHRYLKAMGDVLIYIVVLNLFVEFVDAIVIDSFYISILTAILLTALLDVLVVVEHGVHGYFEKKEASYFRIISIVATFAILFTSKLLILEIVNFVFGDHVELGHFLDVLLLIITMMVVRKLANVVYDRLGETQETPE